jgi:SAM-dependent methyltransferase
MVAGYRHDRAPMSARGLLSGMPSEAARLSDEATFADAMYSRDARHLELNETFYRKYATPQQAWDWRQWGVRRLGSVKGCDLLDLGCGAGEEAVYFAKIGASVTAIDISPVGIQLTAARAAYNGVDAHVRAMLMRCDPTDFADDSFDVIHGFGILHHVGLRPGLDEVHRLLRPGGRGLFFEHMGNSSLLDGLRPKEGRYTEGERPLKYHDVMGMGSRFSRFETKPFHVFSRLRRLMPFFGHATVRRLDFAALRVVPALRHFASGLVIYLEK